MKKAYLYLTLIAFASFSFVSCDEDENTLTEEGGIIGTWEGADEHHWPIATINADGTYVWEWVGTDRFKDEGKYTYEGNKIVMKPSAYYHWEDKGYETTEPWDRGPRKITILDLTPGMMRIELIDYFMGGSDSDGGFEFVLYRQGLAQDIKAKDLEGTWENYESDGSLAERIVISGNNYTAYEMSTRDTILCGSKSVGTWSISKSVITVTPSEVFYSYEMVNNEYVYSVIDPETLEAETWTKARWSPDEYTRKIYLTEDKKTLYVAGVKFTKK
jgi:hypothetical protein